MVLSVSNESTTPELIDNPIFEVTIPKEINTMGEIIRTIKSQGENLSDCLAQIALTELAETAIITAKAI